MNFFVVGIGRSGTTWLAKVLDQSPTHRCAHEEADPRNKVIPQPYAPFPMERFAAAGPDYGECHGMLRYHLSPGVTNGKERLIPRRAWLRRDPRAVIASWMNCGRPRDELPAVIHEVLYYYRVLEQWAANDPDVRVVDMETLTTDLGALQDFVDWLEIGLTVDEGMLRPRNEVLPGRKWFEWGEAERELLGRVARRVGANEEG